MKNDNWIQGVTKEMEKRGTVGAFTKQAKDAGMGVHAFAMKVKDNPEDYTKKTRARATFALNMENISKKRKMAKGGTTQGYDDKLNESLGNRLGREKGYKQSLKDRRDESKAGNKTQGRRAYSSVGTMDKGDSMFAKGGKTTGHINTLQAPKKGDVLYLGKRKGKVIKVMSDMANVDFGSGDVYGITFSRIKGNKIDQGKFTKSVGFAKGGKTQGYNDKLNESLGMRTGKSTSKLQTKKDRRDESKGMEKSSGKRAYSAVGTMDKEFARGGSVEGKIDRDRYVKLQRDNKKVVEKLKKEKGVLRKDFKEVEEKLKKEKGVLRKKFTEAEDQAETFYKSSKKELDRAIECEETRVAPGKGKDTNINQTLLLGGIAGILFGAFLGSR
jgi:hypothetical protein|tara:strand:- start:252 stop:1406 length:1155 start_codon:yes stop_codon:yes gene_type:complete